MKINKTKISLLISVVSLIMLIFYGLIKKPMLYDYFIYLMLIWFGVTWIYEFFETRKINRLMYILIVVVMGIIYFIFKN